MFEKFTATSLTCRSALFSGKKDKCAVGIIVLTLTTIMTKDKPSSLLSVSLKGESSWLRSGYDQ